MTNDAQTPDGLRDEIATEMCRVACTPRIGGWCRDCERRADAVLAAFSGPTNETRAEVAAAVLNEAADACGGGAFNGGRFEGYEYPREWLRARAADLAGPRLGLSGDTDGAR